MLAALRNLTLLAASGAGVVASTLTSRARADDAEYRDAEQYLPKNMYIDAGVKFPGELTLEEWTKQIVASSKDPAERREALEELKRREEVRARCPPIPPRSTWPEVSDEELLEHINKQEEFGLPRDKLIEVARRVYIEDEIASAEIETPLGLEPESVEIVKAQAARETVVDDLLSPVDRQKYDWYMCWGPYFEMCKTQLSMRKAYPGTDEEFHAMYRISQMNTLEHEQYHKCVRAVNASDQDEFLMTRHDRDVLLDKVGKALGQK